jgi:hypothetical protein
MKHVDRLIDIEIMIKGEGKKLWKKIGKRSKSALAGVAGFYGWLCEQDIA